MAKEKGIYFLKLEIEKFRCFGQKQVLNLSVNEGNWKKWTIILGDNGTGKTTLLQMFAALEVKSVGPLGEDSIEHFGPVGLWSDQENFETSRKGMGRLGASLTLDYQETGSFSTSLELGFNNNRQMRSRVFRNQDLDGLKCFGYGANRFMSFNSLTESKSANSETLFNDDAKLINAEEWLLQLDYAASKNSQVQGLAKERRDKVKEILLVLLPEIDKIEFTTPTKESLKSFIQFHTPYGWVTIHQLSLGYKTMVAWIVDLAARMFERYPDSENPLAEPAVVLVDEIDLHLHPKWQRKIFDYLDNLFPGTQFIVTAHSPLVVQSAPNDANIVLLRREGDHVVIDQNIESVKAWRLDQILTSDLFGIESARGPEITKVLEERKELLQKSKLTPEEEKRLNELNQIVHNLPTAESEEDRKAMDIIRKAAEIVKHK